MNARAVSRVRVLFSFLVVAVYLFTLTGSMWERAYAEEILIKPATGSSETATPYTEEINPYFSIEHTTAPDGTPLAGYIINGPPAPLPEFEAERAASIRSTTAGVILPDFPSFSWVFGCSAVSGAMVAGYYDRGAYPNLYAGPTNGGVMPLTDTSWPTWSDGLVTYPNNPLIASHLGVDGLAVKGSIDDYWVQYGSTANDPYITGGWAQHTWGTAIGDFMKTSQSAYNNTDGSTSFWNYNDAPDRLTCADMETYDIDHLDGTYGRKLFYEARGYNVTECYNQNTDNNFVGGFSLANFQAEINAGRPVLLNLAGHTIVGYGYDGSTIYIRDTWNNNPAIIYTMPWGGSYDGMQLLSVSVVHLASTAPTTLTLAPFLIKGYVTHLPPADILLSNSSISESMPINTVVGTFSTTDPNAGDTFTYSLVPGSGDSGNAFFNILGNQLRSSIVFDYESATQYSVRIRTTDQGGLYFEKAFTITIVNVSETTILNGGFEQGHVAWSEYSSNGWSLITVEGSTPTTAHSGDWLAWLGGDYDEISRLSQSFTVPGSSTVLHYWFISGSDDYCGYDFFRIKVNGSTLYTRNLCTTTNTGAWVEGTLSLAAYANTSITLMFEVTTNGSLNSNMFLDDVSLASTAAVSPDVILPGSVDLGSIIKPR